MCMFTSAIAEIAFDWEEFSHLVLKEDLPHPLLPNTVTVRNGRVAMNPSNFNEPHQIHTLVQRHNGMFIASSLTTNLPGYLDLVLGGGILKLDVDHSMHTHLCSLVTGHSATPSASASASASGEPEGGGQAKTIK